MEEKIRHLEMIHSVINRLAANSFQVKGWSVVLTSAILVISAKEAKIYFISLAYFPAIVFWLLDGYYLFQERIFRNLFNKVAIMPSEDVDFNMAPGDAQDETWVAALLSVSIAPFHLVIITSILAVSLMAAF